MKCQINDVNVLLQVIRERREPLAVLREAISNSWDANASEVGIRILRPEAGRVDIEITDNGCGIEEDRFRDFFGLAFSLKSPESIGSKGLGTKLFFNSDMIEVTTRTSRGQCLSAVLVHPLQTLEKRRVPQYSLKRRTDPALRKSGTTIGIHGLRTSSRSPFVAGDFLRAYLAWYTAAGSCRALFGSGRRRFRVKVTRSVRGGRVEEFVVDGHPFPASDSYATSSEFSYRFEPFGFWVLSQDGRKRAWVDVVGAVLGPEAHPVRDKRYKKRFKGVFLAKDYFVIQNVGDVVFGGSGEWQSLHVVANCQELELSMSREGVLETGPGSLYEDLVSALREFASCIKSGKRFRYRGTLIEKGPAYAGKGYSQLKILKDREGTLLSRADRALRVLSLGSGSGMPCEIPGLPSVPPTTDGSLLMLFQALITRASVDGVQSPVLRPLRDLRILDVDMGLPIAVALQRRSTGQWGVPGFYLVKLQLNRDDINRLGAAGCVGAVCWNTFPGIEKMGPELVLLEQIVDGLRR